MNSRSSFKPMLPLKVRREPPTIEEAVSAARELTDDLDEQTEIAAGFMGIPADEARPHVVSAANAHGKRRTVTMGAASSAPGRTIIVERKISRQLPQARARR